DDLTEVPAGEGGDRATGEAGAADRAEAAPMPDGFSDLRDDLTEVPAGEGGDRATGEAGAADRAEAAPMPDDFADAQDDLTEAQATRLFADLNDVIRAGDDARRRRGELIHALADLGWTQDRIARLAGMSQPAVSKHLLKPRAGQPSRSQRRFTDDQLVSSLDQSDVPWLHGRLWALADAVSAACRQTLGAPAHCSAFADALDRGRRRLTPRTADELRRLVEEDLRRHGGWLPEDHRSTYDTVARALDHAELNGPPTAGGHLGPPAVRRATARRIQRERLRTAR
ncbi:hypothetical protein, partial [Streptomyces sp. NPDC060194]|uniref:hypothetical protein n=1 Tax=Streptomyces sp. NPDC060194 TaxID=3347069 RepID=UPI003657CE41